MIKQGIIILTLVMSVTFLFARPATLKGKVLNNTSYTEIKIQDLSYKTIETQKLDENGYFEFKTNFDKFDFYILILDKQIFSIFFPEPGEKTEIILDVNNPQNPKIANSFHSNLYYEYSNHLKENKDEKKRVELIKKMITENTSSPTCIFFVEILKPDTNIAYHESLSRGIAKYSNSQMVKDYIDKTKNIKNLSIGGEASEIELDNPKGQKIKLSSTRGQYVLIDFWASWCGPCRRENPNNVKLYEKYHDKGFEIFAVSLDKEKDAWLKAIEKDNLKWIHVSDLKFWQSAGAKAYNVKGIPHTVLLDKKGKILATGLRGNALEDKLKELFGE